VPSSGETTPKQAEEEHLKPIKELEPLTLPDETEKAFLKLRKKTLEKPDVEQVVLGRLKSALPNCKKSFIVKAA